ncbi:MAG TPA: arylsulfatase [Bacteroidia bacterium]|jgi:arylsulfatase|nr:arylsulfatase [Bacteroidia bacterium]
MIKKYRLALDKRVIFFTLIVVMGACSSKKQQKETALSTEEFKGKIGKTIEDSEEYWPEKKQAPKNAPNVLVFLIDDAGYGTSSAFGGLMETPTLDSLANNGLRYTNFHSTGVCSPTRAALLTGRNHHSVHMGYLNYSSLGFPGYDAIMPGDKATIAEILHENNYNTYAVGKYHLAPLNEITPTGPFDRWPTGRGFDHFFGWQLGHTDQYHPNLYEDNNVVDVEPNTKHVTTLLADKAIHYIANQKSVSPEKPFFLYFATGAIHAPHQVDQKWRDVYKGKFDKGWDWYRKEVFARQKKLGVIPADAILPDRDPTVEAWEKLSPQAQKVYARYMETYAAFMTHADYEFGRIVNYLKQIDQLNNTIIIVSIGDNGSSHSPKHGNYNPYIQSLPKDQQVAETFKHLNDFGTEHSDMDAPSGWTQATNTPFRLWKADANAEGGTHQPLIIFYPNGIKERGIRNQYGHVIDIAPTILELVGAKIPDVIKGYKQQSIEGTSLAYSIHDASAASKHTIQYYELRGKRAIYKDGWKASVFHITGTPFDKDIWELYDVNTDFNERIDLAKKNPQKLKELQDQFDIEAKKYNVYPLIDASKVGGSAGRNRSVYGNANKIVLYPGVNQLMTYSGPQFPAQSFSITAEIGSLSKNDEGVLFATGDEFDGLSLYIKNGKFEVAHNTGSKIKYLNTGKPLTTGNLSLKFELTYIAPSGSRPKGTDPAGTEAIYVDNIKIDEHPVSIDEAKYIANYRDGIDVGQDLNSPVTDHYTSPFKFSGALKRVIIEYK